MSSQGSYQTVYHVGLLDDLHNYFPEILYNRGRFQNVPSLLEYIHQQIETQVNPFARGARLYREANPVVSARPATTAAPPPLGLRTLSPLRATAAAIPPVAAAPPIRLNPGVTTIPPLLRTPRAHPDPLYMHPAASLVTETYDLTDMLGLNGGGGGPGGLANVVEALLGLANLPPGANSMTPVVVRATNEQIDSATQLRQATPSDEEESCAICQEDFTDGQAIRSIRQCGHDFHRNCIDPWFERDVHCPVCRHDIRE